MEILFDVCRAPSVKRRGPLVGLWGVWFSICNNRSPSFENVGEYVYGPLPPEPCTRDSPPNLYRETLEANKLVVEGKVIPVLIRMQMKQIRLREPEQRLRGSFGRDVGQLGQL